MTAAILFQFLTVIRISTTIILYYNYDDDLIIIIIIKQCCPSELSKRDNDDDMKRPIRHRLSDVADYRQWRLT